LLLSSEMLNHLGDLAEELRLLPDTHQISYLADLVADFITPVMESENVSSSIDLKKLVAIQCDNLLGSMPVKQKDRIKDLTYDILDLYQSSNNKDVGELSFKDKRDNIKPQSEKRILALGDKVGFVVRIPSFDRKDKAQMEHLSKYLHWACVMLNVDKNSIRLSSDTTLGDRLYLSKKIEDNFDKCIFSTTIEGNPLDAYVFRTGMKATIPETVAALKVLRESSLKVMRNSPKVKPLTANELRENLNIRFGINEQNVPSFTQSFVKAVLNEMTKPGTQRLPGRFLHSLKTQNKKSSKTGILATMGYAPKALPYIKVQFLLKHKIVEEAFVEKGASNKFSPVNPKKRLVMKEFKPEKDEEKIRSLRERRLALVTALPYINPNLNKKIKEQVLVDAMSTGAAQAMRYFAVNRRLADAVNLAFATKASLDKKGSKSTLKGLNNLYNRAYRLSAHVPLTDATGKTYTSYFEVPENIRSAINKSIGHEQPEIKPTLRKEQENKASKQEAETSVEEHPDEEESDSEESQFDYEEWKRSQDPNRIWEKDSFDKFIFSLKDKEIDKHIGRYNCVPAECYLCRFKGFCPDCYEHRYNESGGDSCTCALYESLGQQEAEDREANL
jgi:hypothetical protein